MPPALSAEIWACVLQHLQPDTCRATGDGTVYDHAWSRYSEFQRLKLVCKLFNEILTQQPSFANFLLLPYNLPSRSMPSLLRWVQRFGGAVTFVAAQCDSEYASAALGVLACHDPQVREALFERASCCTANLLAAFTALTICDLSGDLDLLPLQNLPTLSKLRLHNGYFHNLQAAAYLTNLYMDRADATAIGPCVFTNSLAKLSLRDGECTLAGGVSACSNLKMLRCASGNIHASGGAAFLAFRFKAAPFFTPAGMTALSQMTALHLSSSMALYDLDCAYQLTNLQCIYAQFTHILLTEQLTMLRSLRTLTVCGPLNGASTLIMGVPWKEMLALQHLSLFDGNLMLITDLSDLVHVKSLRSVALRKCGTDIAVSSSRMRALVSTLRRCRPDVHLRTDL